MSRLKASGKRSLLPSAHDVARLAGVSQAAVSRAFTPGASISEAMRTKVVEAAKTLGYRPNLLARSLITGRSGIVGVIIGNTRNPFFLDALEALSERLSKAGQHLLLFTAQTNADTDRLVEDLLQYRVDALLLMSAGLSVTLAQRCRDEGIPIIYFNRRPTLEGFPSVTGTNQIGGRAIGMHMFDQGYRRLAYMAGYDKSSTSREREAGFREGLSERGMADIIRVTGHFDREGAMEAARDLLTLPEPPDAIFCANDFIALAVMDCARHQFGLAIGRQLGIAGFDDIEGASWPSWDLTTFSQPVEKMIDRVAELLFDPERLASAPHIMVAGELKIRGSTRR